MEMSGLMIGCAWHRCNAHVTLNLVVLQPQSAFSVFEIKNLTVHQMNGKAYHVSGN